MKKIIAVILAIAVVICLGACSRTKPGEFEQSPLSIAQNEIISSLGKTVEGSRIVAYENGVNYVKYIVAEYINGIKMSEKTHYFYSDKEAYEIFCEPYAGDETVTTDGEKLYLCMKTNVAVNNDYDLDKEFLGKKHFIK